MTATPTVGSARPAATSTIPAGLTTRLLVRAGGRATVGVTAGTDGSYWGQAALTWAAHHAWLTGTNLRICEADRQHAPLPADLPPDLGTSVTLRAFPLLDVTVRASGPDPTTGLLTTSAGSALLVVGYRGHHHTGLGPGRTATTLAAQARCPVLVARGRPATLQHPHRHVTALVSGAAGDDDLVVALAVEMAHAYRSALRILHAWPHPGGAVQGPDPARILAQAQARVATTGPAKAVEVLRCPPHEAITRLAGTDLLVLGRHDCPTRSGGLGVMARTALHHAPCPVLLAGGG